MGARASDSLPAGVIPKTMRRYLCRQAEEDGDKQVIANRYEFWIYRLMRSALEAGDLFCQDSVRFRSFEDDLIDGRQWQHKQSLTEEAGLAAFKQPAGEHLAGLEQQA